MKDLASIARMELAPALMKKLYVDLLRRSAHCGRARERFWPRFEAYLEKHAETRLRPVLRYLRKEKRLVPLSELADHFAHSQLFPGIWNRPVSGWKRRGESGNFPRRSASPK